MICSKSDFIDPRYAARDCVWPNYIGKSLNMEYSWHLLFESLSPSQKHPII